MKGKNNRPDHTIPCPCVPNETCSGCYLQEYCRPKVINKNQRHGVPKYQLTGKENNRTRESQVTENSDKNNKNLMYRWYKEQKELEQYRKEQKKERKYEKQREEDRDISGPIMRKRHYAKDYSNPMKERVMVKETGANVKPMVQSKQIYVKHRSPRDSVKSRCSNFCYRTCCKLYCCLTWIIVVIIIILLVLE